MALGKRDFKTAFKSDNLISSSNMGNKKQILNQPRTEKSNVKVFIRIRPFNEKEKANGCR